MILIYVPINAIFLTAAITAGFSAGYVLRTVRLRNLKRRVYELESEMLRNHAEILDLQRAVAPKKTLSSSITQYSDPVLVPIDKLTDAGSKASGKTGS